MWGIESVCEYDMNLTSYPQATQRKREGRYLQRTRKDQRGRLERKMLFSHYGPKYTW